MSDDNYIPGTTIKKPRVKLVGQDGNAFFIIGRVRAALKQAGAPDAVLKAFADKAMSGDYDNVLATACEYTDAR